MSSFTTVNAQQVENIHHYEYVKEKLYKTNAPILCNKIRRTYRLILNEGIAVCLDIN